MSCLNLSFFKKKSSLFLASILLFFITACGGLDEMIESTLESTGISPLDTEQINNLKTAAGWDSEKLSDFIIHGGI